MPLRFVGASSDTVNFGKPVSLQDIEVGTIFIKARPTEYPAAGIRALLYINGVATGFRDAGFSGSAGASAVRLLIDRATTIFQVSVAPADLPFGAANRWCDWAITWDINATNADQHIYGGATSPFHPMEEATTYHARDVGSGAATSSNTQDTVLGGRSSDAFPGDIAFCAVWAGVKLTLAELRRVQKLLDLGPPLPTAAWYPGADGGAVVNDLMAGGVNGTITGATVVDDPDWKYHTLRPSTKRPAPFRPGIAR